MHSFWGVCVCHSPCASVCWFKRRLHISYYECFLQRGEWTSALSDTSNSRCHGRVVSALRPFHPLASSAGSGGVQASNRAPCSQMLAARQPVQPFLSLSSFSQNGIYSWLWVWGSGRLWGHYSPTTQLTVVGSSLVDREGSGGNRMGMGGCAQSTTTAICSPCFPLWPCPWPCPTMHLLSQAHPQRSLSISSSAWRASLSLAGKEMSARRLCWT